MDTVLRKLSFWSVGLALILSTGSTVANATVSECSYDAVGDSALDQAKELVRGAVKSLLDSKSISFDPAMLEVTAVARTQHYNILPNDGLTQKAEGNTYYIDVNASVVTKRGGTVRMSELSLFSSGPREVQRLDVEGEKLGSKCILDFSKAPTGPILLRLVQTGQVLGKLDSTAAFSSPSLVNVIENVIKDQ